MVAPASPALPLPPIALTLGLWMAVALLRAPDASSAAAAVAAMAVLVLAARRLLARLGAAQPARGAASILLLPGVGFGATGDALWLAAVVLALVAALARRPRAMFGWYGLALGLSPCALLIAPLMLALALQRRAPAHLWPIVPMMALGIGSAAGTPWTMPGAYAGGANLWGIAAQVPWIGAWPLGGLALATSIGTAAAFAAWFARRGLSGTALLAAAALCTLANAALVPGMTAESWRLGALLAVLLALARQRRLAWSIAALAQGGIAVTLIGAPVSGALPLLVAALLLARAVFASAANDNAPIAATSRRTPARAAPPSMIGFRPIRPASGDIGHVP